MVALGYILLTIIVIAYDGLILSVMWNWFIVPLGAPPVTIAHAYGINLVVNLFTLKVNTARDRDLPAWATTLVQMIAATILLGIGWIVHLFM